MEKNKNKPSNEVRTTSMLSQKTNEDFNKKQPGINDFDPKQESLEIKLPKIVSDKKNVARKNNVCSPVVDEAVSVNNNSDNNMIFDANIKDSYVMQFENIQKNIANSNKICKNRFL